MKEKKKHPILRFFGILFWIILVFAIIGIINTDEEVVEKTKDGVTYEQFLQIEKGMTIAEVESIVGTGELVSTFENAEMYSWKGAEIMSSMTVDFYNGKVVSKTQIGLE